MVIDRPLVLALGKGRMFEETTHLFDAIGFEMAPVRRARQERKMFADEGGGCLRVLLAKDADVPVYVEHGVADMGIVGRDVLWESGADVLVPLLLGALLPSSRCRMVLAGPPRWRGRNLRAEPSLTIATKYPNIARHYVWERGLSAEVLGLSGNIELACTSGLADLIVDIVQTGTTLRENNLVELETILQVEAALIVNRAAHKLRPHDIQPIVQALETLLAERRQPNK
nr:ATP phosphoribosyltransferase [Ardenticatena sp.]